MKLCLLIVFLSFEPNLFAFNRLRIIDPRGWYNEPGSIDSATIITRPKGFFLEVSMILNFSAKNLWYSPTDSFEIVFDFELPDNAAINESWLWLDPNIILRGKIFDKWTASTIYEDIVKRRRDPSILRKFSPNQYQLRIFPMQGNAYRKVKIVYLIPMNLNKSIVSTELNVPFLTSSHVPLKEVSLICLNQTGYEIPYIEIEGDEVNLFEKEQQNFGRYHYKNCSISEILSNIIVKYELVSKKTSYYCSYNDQNSKYYQIAIDPEYLNDEISAQNILICLDYTTGRHDKVWSHIQTQLLKQYNSKSKFNVCFIDRFIQPKLVFGNWEPITLEKLEKCNEVIVKEQSFARNLQSLLINGVDYIVKNSEKAKIFLVTSDFDSYTPEYSNQLIETITKLSNKEIPFFISDINTSRSNCRLVQNLYYCNNEYLFTNLSRVHKGEYFLISNSLISEKEVIEQGLKSLLGSIYNLDIYVKPTNGISFNRYHVTPERTNLADGLRQVGRFTGGPPFLVEVSGLLNGKEFTNTISIPVENVVYSDESNAQIWAGYFLRNNEWNTSNGSINSCIGLSTEYKVLSANTAFLCLEDTSYYCSNCLDESKLNTKVEETSKDSIQFKAFPNPFTDQVEITFSLEISDEIVSLNITDLQGRLMESLKVTREEGKKFRASWSPSHGVKSGIYFGILTTKNLRRSIKLIKT